jgi:two-component system sensor histidine kinase UhpB
MHRRAQRSARIAPPSRAISDRYWAAGSWPVPCRRRIARSAPKIARDEEDTIDPLGDKRDLEAKYQTLIEQIPAIVYIWGVAGGLEHVSEEYVSPQIEAVLGFRADDWMANPRLWVDRLHPEDRDEVLDETGRSVEAGEPFKLEYRMVARDGRVIWLHDVASVLARDDRGRATRYQGVQLDITARKEAEQAQRRSHEQLRLLNRQRRDLVERLVETQEEERRRISEGIHDDSMQGLFAALVRLSTVTAERPELGQIEALSSVREEIQGVIDRLRHLAFELHPRILDAEGLRASLRFLIERWSSMQAGVEFHLEDRLTKEPSKQASLTIYRIAQEALSNAGHHSAASSVTISLEDRAGGVLIRVEDDGSGFDVVATLSSTRERLGLISMRERVEMLGGWLQVDSVPGAGTRVEGWLPDTGPERDQGSRLEEGATEREELSPREHEVAELLALGHTNAEVGAILRISVRTVEHHRSRVFRKLGVRSRAGLVQALREQLPRDPDPQR